MNTTALRLATGRKRGYRRWNVTGYGNGNSLSIGLGLAGIVLKWPVNSTGVRGYLLPRQPHYRDDRAHVKAALRDFLTNHATTF
jgi:hypothetical protein